MNSNVAVLLPYPTEGGGILLISTTADGIMIMIIDHEDVEPARVYVCVCIHIEKGVDEEKGVG